MCHAIEHIKNKYISVSESKACPIYISSKYIKINTNPKKLFFSTEKMKPV